MRHGMHEQVKQKLLKFFGNRILFLPEVNSISLLLASFLEIHNVINIKGVFIEEVFATWGKSPE